MDGEFSQNNLIIMVAKSQKQKQTEKFDIKEIYTPLSVAKKEIWKRWNDKELRKKVEDFLGGDVPEVLQKKPRATLVRHVATPNIELSYFLDLAKEINLNPIYLEYSKDRFVAKNKNKYYICKFYIYNGKGKKWGDKVHTVKIVDFNTSEGKKFINIKTLWGERFIDFHHRILNIFSPEIRTFDISNWLNKRGLKSDIFYTHYLSLFVCHGVLFENFLNSGKEKEFTVKIVLPSLKRIENIFGIKPLIVPLDPIEDEANLYWYYYPQKIKMILDKK